MRLSLKGAAIGLAMVVGIAYASGIANSLRYSTFHFDDSHSVEANLAIRSIWNIPQFWLDPRTSSFIPENRVYRPMVYTLYSFCWALGGGKTWPFHVMKLLMHWGVALALFLIWKKLWEYPGWFPASGLKLKIPFDGSMITVDPSTAAVLLSVIFAVHPAASECVDYISATTSLQCALFYVWAYYAYLLFRERGENRILGASLLLYFLSVASKEEGITLPAVVGVTELLLRQPSASGWKVRALSAMKSALPFVALGVVLAAWVVLMRPAEGHESRGYATSFEYFITQWRAYLWYMRLWFWPWDLNADSAALEFSRSLFEPLVIQAAIGNLLILAVAWYNRRRVPALLFGVAWFYITISPASSVVVLAEAINEHRMYLAYIGFVGGVFTVLLMGAEALFDPQSRPVRLGWVYLAIVAGLVMGTQDRNRVWANSENLWSDTVEKNPGSGRALNNLALVYLGRGEYPKAIGLLERCERAWTTYLYCPLNQGVAFNGLAENAAKEGKSQETRRFHDLAERAFERAYQLNPRNVHVNFHLGKHQDEVMGNCPQALGYYRTAVELTGGRHPAAEARLAGCYSKLGKKEEARAAIRRALSQDPSSASVIFERGRVELEKGDVESAARTYRVLLDQEPEQLQAELAPSQLEFQRRLEELRKRFRNLGGTE